MERKRSLTCPNNLSKASGRVLAVLIWSHFIICVVYIAEYCTQANQQHEYKSRNAHHFSSHCSFYGIINSTRCLSLTTLDPRYVQVKQCINTLKLCCLQNRAERHPERIKKNSVSRHKSNKMKTTVYVSVFLIVLFQLSSAVTVKVRTPETWKAPALNQTFCQTIDQVFSGL